MSTVELYLLDIRLGKQILYKYDFFIVRTNPDTWEIDVRVQVLLTLAVQ